MVDTRSSPGKSRPIHPCRWHPNFSAPGTDALLQSSDSILFSVHRCILAEASTIFNELFLKSSPSSSDQPAKPLILAETGTVLASLLRLIYPLPPPIFNSLQELTAVLAACIKYDMSASLQVVRQTLVSPEFISREPLRVYAIACRYRLQEEAREASRATLQITLLDAPLYEELRYISAYDYHRLLTMHRARAGAAKSLLSLRSRNCPVRCSGCSGKEEYGKIARWWHEFERRAKEELTRRPLTDIIFSMRFLSECANAGCERCGTSILDSYVFMEKLKAEMDALPDTVAL